MTTRKKTSPKFIVQRADLDTNAILELVNTGLAMAAVSEKDEEGDFIQCTMTTGIIFSEHSRRIIAAYEHNAKAIAEVADFGPDSPDCDIDESFDMRHMLAKYFYAGFIAGSRAVLTTGGAQ